MGDAGTVMVNGLQADGRYFTPLDVLYFVLLKTDGNEEPLLDRRDFQTLLLALRKDTQQ